MNARPSVPAVPACLRVYAAPGRHPSLLVVPDRHFLYLRFEDGRYCAEAPTSDADQVARFYEIAAAYNAQRSHAELRATLKECVGVLRQVPSALGSHAQEVAAKAEQILAALEASARPPQLPRAAG